MTLRKVLIEPVAVLLELVVLLLIVVHAIAAVISVAAELLGNGLLSLVDVLDAWATRPGAPAPGAGGGGGGDSGGGGGGASGGDAWRRPRARKRLLGIIGQGDSAHGIYGNDGE